MKDTLKQKFEDAIWVTSNLFSRGKATGSSANMSFRHKDKIYITGSGTCFGNLSQESFSVIDLEGNHISGIKPSKEAPLHLAMYNRTKGTMAVIHTHSFYSVVWSMLPHSNSLDCVPTYTPYLRMKLGDIALVPYAKPGSEELFNKFREILNEQDGYLLANHGPVVASDSILSAFYNLEELEESAKIAWELRKEDIKGI